MSSGENNDSNVVTEQPTEVEQMEYAESPPRDCTYICANCHPSNCLHFPDTGECVDCSAKLAEDFMICAHCPSCDCYDRESSAPSCCGHLCGNDGS